MFAEFLDLFLTNGFLPLISLPTRFSKKNATIIDQIFCKISDISAHSLSGILLTQTSDHLPSFSCLDIINFKKSASPKFIKIQINDSQSQRNFCNAVSQADIISKLDARPHTDPNENYLVLCDTLKLLREKHLPTKTVKFHKHKHKKSPWISISIIKSIQHRDKLYSKLLSTKPDNSKYQELKTNLATCNSILQKNVRQAKQSYYQNLLKKCQDNIKKTWNTVNLILSKGANKKDFPSSFMCDGTEITDKSLISNKFNEYFATIGPKLAAKITDTTNNSFKSYLKNNINSTFNFKIVSTETIQNIFKDLKPKKSSGHDELSIALLKNISHNISAPLTQIINQSLTTGIFPAELKIAIVTPIIKKGDKQLFENYRPISLIPALSKVFEKVVYNQLSEYLDKKKLLYESQYGFRKLHSTELACLEFIDKTLADLDKGNLPLSVSIDLSKAFDTLDHNILLFKLDYYGIKNTEYNWFKSYLSQRTQIIKIHDTLSSPLPMQTGVPQGSILGPLLFILYMNDICESSNLFDFVLYADDTTLSAPLGTFIYNPQHRNQIPVNINSELNKIYQWLSTNKLSLNIEKTKFMVFHFNQKRIDKSKIPHLEINGIPIKQVHDFNFLGLTISDTLSWHAHIEKISIKISRTLGIMNRLKHIVNSDILRLLYNSLILSHINFSLLSWGSNTSRIFKLQKKAVRIITKSKYNSHTEPLFQSLNLLKISDLYQLKLLKFYYNYCNNKLPSYFKDLFIRNADVHSHITRQTDQLHTPAAKHVTEEQGIRYALPPIVNKTQSCILEKIESHSYQGFSLYIKRHVISTYNFVCNNRECYVCNSNS